MGAMSRQKGKRGELELAHVLTDAGFPASRGGQWRGSPWSPDIVCRCLPGLHFEVKRTEHLRLYDALTQAARDAGEGVPVVAHRASDRPWVAILRLSDFLAILRKSNLVQPEADATAAEEGPEP